MDIHIHFALEKEVGIAILKKHTETQAVQCEV